MTSPRYYTRFSNIIHFVKMRLFGVYCAPPATYYAYPQLESTLHNTPSYTLTNTLFHSVTHTHTSQKPLTLKYSYIHRGTPIQQLRPTQREKETEKQTQERSQNLQIDVSHFRWFPLHVGLNTIDLSTQSVNNMFPLVKYEGLKFFFAVDSLHFFQHRTKNNSFAEVCLRHLL